MWDRYWKKFVRWWESNQIMIHKYGKNNNNDREWSMIVENSKQKCVCKSQAGQCKEEYIGKME